MAAEDFTAFLARMAAPEGFTTQEFVKDLGEALLLEGALQSHEWTVANPSRVQRSFHWRIGSRHLPHKHRLHLKCMYLCLCVPTNTAVLRYI